MKKQIVCILFSVLAICCSACGATQITPNETALDSSETASIASAEAFETNRELSQEEMEQEENARREEISEQYSIYSEYGLSYDKGKDRFFYDGNIVRYFNDKINDEQTNSFFYEDGSIDLKPIRNASDELIGLEIATEDEFAARTEKQNNEKSAIPYSGSGTYEGGNPNVSNDTLTPYIDYGISYNSENQKWIYDGKEIYLFYDSQGAIFIDYSASDGISLKVVRDAKNNIKQIVRITADEIEQYLNIIEQ